MPTRAFLFVLIVGLALVPWRAQAQSLLPGFNNPLFDPGADRRKAEDNRRIAEFPRIDTDGNGTLDAAELAAHRTRLFTRLDKNGDQRLNRSEFRLFRLDPAPGMAARAFSSLDSNGDDSVTLTEYTAAGRATTRSADIDGDGRLSSWEYRTQD